MISGNAKEQTFKDWIWARNIRDETLMNLAKNILHAYKSWFTVSHKPNMHSLTGLLNYWN